MSKTLAWGESIQVVLGIGIPVNIFTLNDPVLGLLDGVGVLDGNNEADVTEYVQSVSINRGRSDNFAQFSTGSCSIQLLNTARIFDPINTASPFYDTSTNTSGITPKRSIKVVSNGIDLFTGKIQDIDIAYDIESISTLNISSQDGFVELATAIIESDITPSIEASGTRLETILNLGEVNWTAGRDIDTGTQSLGAYPITTGTNVLGYCQQIAEAEFSYLYVKGDGSIRFTDRIAAAFATSIAATFTDDGTDLSYETLGITYGSEQLVNKVIASTQTGSTVTSDDLASQTTYGILTTDLTDLLLETDTQAQTLADLIVAEYSEPKYRFDDISVSYSKLSTPQQTTVSSIDLSEFIKVIRNFDSGSPTEVTQVTRCESIRHTITPAGHRVELRLSPAVLVYPMILDDAIYGLLDNHNAVS